MTEGGPTSTPAPVEITVWAPLASTVEAVVGERRTPLARDGAFWATELPAGTDYLLSVDGGQPVPHPRSRRQPYGVHGPSRVTDLDAHQWGDAAWPGIDPLGEVFYELHVGTFTPEGTLDAAIGRLPHLVDLGVGLVELMPVTPFPGERGWGYDAVSLFAVHESYGGPEALQRFVDAAHQLGLGVCLDVVHNHFGPAGNYTGSFGPYMTDRHATPWGQAINLDDEHAAGVRAFIIDNVRQWLRDFHVDALRLDAVHALHDESPRHLLAELADAVDELETELGRPASLIAESDLNDVAMVTPTDAGGLGMDAQWADDVHHALHSYLTGETFGYYVDFGAADTLVHALTSVFVHDGTWSTFRDRPWGAPVPDAVDRRRFVVFSQNHDQVGNRALGDRPEALHGAGVAAASAAIVLLGPFTPLLFQGQEWGATTPFQFFTDHDDDLGALVKAGRRAEFATHGWAELYGDDLVVPDPQSAATFAGSKLDWSEVDAPAHQALLAWHRDLIRLRRDLLAGGGHRVRADFGDGWFRMVHGPVTVVIARRACALEEPRGTVAAAFGQVSASDGTISLGSDAVAVLTD